MKIQKLIIHNIASIEDAEIDFNASPLADSDVFLISGKTGSGKSTILDAICLALYKSTPRLENTKMQGKVVEGKKEIQIDDPVQLLRENTGEGYVKLTFEGSNGLPYEAEWSIARARNKPTGNLQAKKWTLKDLHSGTIYTKDGEIEAEIVKAVKLSFDQFCRTTMLAQGEFTRFLNSKDEEKAEILEMITGAGIYSKIGAKVYEKTQQKEKEYQDAFNAIQGIHILSQEERDEKKSEIDSKNQGIQDALKARDASKAKAKWIEDNNNYIKLLNDAQTALTEAEAAATAEDFQSEKALLASLKETQEVRRSLETEATEKKKEEGAKRSIGLMVDCYQQLRSGVRYLQEKEVGIKNGLEMLEGILEKEKPDLPVIDKAQAIESQLGIIDTGYNKIAELNSEIDSAEKKLNEELIPVRDSAKQSLSQADKAKGEAAEALKKAEKALGDADIPGIRLEITKLTAMQGALQLAHDRIVRHIEAGKARKDEADSIQEKEREVQAMLESREIIAKEVEELRINAEVERRSYERESMSADSAITAIRSKLSIGNICPVCMQEIKASLPTDEEIAARLKPMWEAQEAARLNYEAKRDKLASVEAAIKAETSRLSQRKTNHEKDNSVSNAEVAVIEALKACQIDVYDEKTDAVIEKELESINKRLIELNSLESKGRVLETSALSARTASDSAGKKWENAKAAFDTAEKNVSDVCANLDTKRELKESHKKDIKAAVAVIEAAVNGSRWMSDWHNDRKAFEKELAEAAKAHEASLQKQQTLMNDKRIVAETISTVSGILSDVERLVPVWKSLEPLPARELENLERTATELKDDILIERQNEKNAHETSLAATKIIEAFINAHINYNREILATLSNYTPENIRELEDNQKKIVDVLTATKASYATISSQIAEHTAKRPVFEDGETLEMLTEQAKASDAQALELSGRVTLLEKELENEAKNAEKIGELADKAEKLKAVWIKWDRLNSLIGDNTGKKFRKIAQSYVLGSLVSAANHYMRDLTDRYTLKVVPGTFIISLEDAYQGYVSRPASTISGGESFLVSLSLALALSDIGDSLSVDTLFIDEGFGTLSGAPLQNAVNTLKSLRTKAGKHVGIISHIEELQERIPVQILVEQNDRTSSSTIRVSGGD